MCAIFGSFDKETFKELHKINSYRGEVCNSLSAHCSDGSLHITQNRGPMFDSNIEQFFEDHPGCYIIGHTQAPTGPVEINNIHPAIYGAYDPIASHLSSCLWHNGIIKPQQIPADTWDTEWLLTGLMTQDIASLSHVQGSFACVFYTKGDLYLFRNAISPLFYDPMGNVSSTKFEGSQMVPHNKMWHFDPHGHTAQLLYAAGLFDNKENPYDI